MAIWSVFRMFRRLVPERVSDLSSADEKSVSTRISELMKKPHRGVTLTAWKETWHRVLLSVLALGLLCLTIGIGEGVPKDFLHSTTPPHLHGEDGDGADEAQCGDGICEADEAAESCPRDCLLGNISIIKKLAAHGSFSPDDSKIVVDRPKRDRFYDLYIIDLEGNIIQSLTDGNPLVNQRDNSWPVWHPTEDYIVFQSEEEKHWKRINKSFSDPGLGFFHNLYAIRSDGQQVWKLTDIPIKKRRRDGIPIYASVNPCLNSDGSKLMWAERYDGGGTHDWGYWRIKMADFIIGPGGPELRNITVVLDPPVYCGSDDCQYANGMAFINDTTILVTGNLDGQHVFGMDLYSYDLASKQLTNLLNTPEYWEEGAAYANNRIVYMTNIDSEYILDFDDPNWSNQPRTREYWIMNADGSNKRRLTYFNSAHSPEYQDLSKGRRTIVAKCNFSHDGSKMIGTVGFDHGDDDTVQITLNLGLFEFQE